MMAPIFVVDVVTFVMYGKRTQKCLTPMSQIVPIPYYIYIYIYVFIHLSETSSRSSSGNVAPFIFWKSIFGINEKAIGERIGRSIAVSLGGFLQAAPGGSLGGVLKSRVSGAFVGSLDGIFGLFIGEPCGSVGRSFGGFLGCAVWY